MLSMVGKFHFTGLRDERDDIFMANLEGFFSYVHRDDVAEGGRICQLARDIKDQYEMLTGESISLFIDRDAIKWGEKWKELIDKNLASVAFFIPVLTPRYFQSPECRRELNSFARRATELGYKDLILSLLYADISSLEEEDDALVKLARSFQWEDWRDLRFKEIKSEEYRAAVAKLASRLVEANRESEAISKNADLEVPEEGDDSPGLIDRIVSAEEDMPKLVETINSITKGIEDIGGIMRVATEDIARGDSQGQGYGPRLTVIRKLTHQLTEPVNHVTSQGNEFVTQLHNVDQGISELINQSTKAYKEDKVKQEDVSTFFSGIRNMADSSCNAMDSIQSMIDTIVPIEGLSRDLRPVLRQLKQGLIVIVESREVIENWVRLMDSANV